jgi:CheY-like chemotaxis protein
VEESGRVHVEEIQKAGERAARLAGQLLAFGRRQVLQPRVMRLDDVLRQMQPMLQRLLGEDVEVRLDLRLGAGAVEADLGQLEQVILNLAVNARDAMPYGGTLTLSTAGVHLGEEFGLAPIPAGDYVQLGVADTGMGMDPETLARAFEPFFTTKESGKGTGLGLATVHGIVHQSGGDIRVDSSPGAGTRFTILLPRAAATSEPEPERAAAPAESARGSETILLVEDEDNIRGPAVEILESRGYRVLAASHAAEALAKAERHAGAIPLLVTDVVMPGMSGGQLAEHLARIRPDVKVLYMSGYPEDAISHHGVLSPEQRFLQKPFAVNLLLRTVRDVLDTAPGTRIRGTTPA